MPRDALRRWYERFGFEATTEHLVAYWPGRLGLEMRRGPRCPLYNSDAHRAGDWLSLVHKTPPIFGRI
jgi:hypothetical protein